MPSLLTVAIMPDKMQQDLWGIHPHTLWGASETTLKSFKETKTFIQRPLKVISIIIRYLKNEVRNEKNS